MYIVFGGVYTGTDFKTLEPGTHENYGPFESYEEAYDAWRAKTGWKVDICCHRLFISELKLIHPAARVA